MKCYLNEYYEILAALRAEIRNISNQLQEKTNCHNALQAFSQAIGSTMPFFVPTNFTALYQQENLGSAQQEHKKILEGKADGLQKEIRQLEVSGQAIL